MLTTIVLTALIAAMVNGAIGYGFSTLMVPIALLYYPSQILNPGLVVAEVSLNLLSLFINRRGLPGVWRRILPMLIASLPGIVIGGYVLKNADSSNLRLATFAILLPLVLMQAAGFRRPIRPGSPVELPIGFGIGVLYSCTTISGPPLGLLFNNQGLRPDEFRAAMSLFRVTESIVTGVVYYTLAVYTPQSLHLSKLLLPCILIGIPLGRLFLQSVDAETFRRLCMAFDAWLISFGLSRVLVVQGGVFAYAPYAPMLLVIALDAVILFRYFRSRRR